MIIAIYAINKAGWFGNYNEETQEYSLPWVCPEDLNHFKATTLNQIVIMGSGTWKSLGRKLPNRTNIVITSRPGEIQDPDVITFSNPQQALEFVKDKDAYVIGGQLLLESMRSDLDMIMLSRIDDFTQANIPAPDVGLGSIFERTGITKYKTFTLEVYTKINDNKD